MPPLHLISVQADYLPKGSDPRVRLTISESNNLPGLSLDTVSSIALSLNEKEEIPANLKQMLDSVLLEILSTHGLSITSSNFSDTQTLLELNLGKDREEIPYISTSIGSTAIADLTTKIILDGIIPLS